MWLAVIGSMSFALFEAAFYEWLQAAPANCDAGTIGKSSIYSYVLSIIVSLACKLLRKVES